MSLSGPAPIRQAHEGGAQNGRRLLGTIRADAVRTAAIRRRLRHGGTRRGGHSRSSAAATTTMTTTAAATPPPRPRPAHSRPAPGSRSSGGTARYPIFGMSSGDPPTLYPYENITFQVQTSPATTTAACCAGRLGRTSSPRTSPARRRPGPEPARTAGRRHLHLQVQAQHLLPRQGADERARSNREGLPRDVGLLQSAARSTPLASTRSSTSSKHRTTTRSRSR